MTDVRNSIVDAVPSQWLPAVYSSQDGAVLIDFRTWDGDPDAWSTTSQQTQSLSVAMLHALGAAMLDVLGGGTAPTTVAPGTAGDPECVVDVATVGGRRTLTLTFRDATMHVAIGSTINFDAEPAAYEPASGYAERCAVGFRDDHCFGL